MSKIKIQVPRIHRFVTSLTQIAKSQMADDGKDWIDGDGDDWGEEEGEGEKERNGKVQTAPS